VGGNSGTLYYGMAVCASQLARKIIFLTLSKGNDSNEQFADKNYVFIGIVCPQYLALREHQCLLAVSLCCMTRDSNTTWGRTDHLRSIKRNENFLEVVL
jgi:hypothetical protein